VHIDVFSAQTGISKFLEINRASSTSNWHYDKSENLLPASRDMLQFTHLLIEADSETHSNLQPYNQTHTILSFVRAFNGIYLAPTSYKKILWPKIKFKPKIFILKRKNIQ
jgi:hypothetical protein